MSPPNMGRRESNILMTKTFKKFIALLMLSLVMFNAKPSEAFIGTCATTVISISSQTARIIDGICCAVTIIVTGYRAATGKLAD